MPADRIRCVYELQSFLQQFVQTIPVSPVYPKGIEVIAPLATTSDDFSFAIGGIPALRNDFQDSPFIRTHYHSQFDNETTFNREAMLFHLQLYGELIQQYDKLAVVPLDFSIRLQAMLCSAPNELLIPIQQALAALNNTPIFTQQHQSALLDIFYFMETHFTKLTWHDEVIFPYQHTMTNCQALSRAIEYLKVANIEGALLNELHRIDNNWQAYDFDRAVYEHFTNYVLNAEPERLLWGAGRIVGHIDLFEIIQSLQAKQPKDNVEKELQLLQQALTAQQQLHKQVITEMKQHLATLCTLFNQL